ncbi:MAG: formylglycine-generating enzyme family protein [Pirellulales bacterium]|nr:formylglycine-generating enzyme family protein [Pirellulales bacterium]
MELPVQKTIELGDGLKLEMVLIPAGSFIMGDDSGADDEKPAHKVAIAKAFYLGKYEVTVEQFRRFIEATGHRTDAEKGTGFQGAFGWNPETMQFKMNEDYSWRSTGFPQSTTHPVVNVSWNDAMEFCKWLGREGGTTYRLPTEAEWEYACRAGTTTGYYHGDDSEGSAKAGNVADAAFEGLFPELKGMIQASDGYAYTSPAGSFLPNPFGLYDMHGNVWEWCADWYDPEYYAKSPADNPAGPAVGDERVYRGGGWFNCTRGCRSASRSGSVPENRNLTLGFRVAWTAE